MEGGVSKGASGLGSRYWTTRSTLCVGCVGCVGVGLGGGCWVGALDQPDALVRLKAASCSALGSGLPSQLRPKP